jgi:CBS domain-containing protein
MAYGLPVEGADGPFLGGQVSEVATCDVGLTVGDARRLLDETAAGSVVVLAGDSLVVGELEAEMLHGHGDDERLLDVMDPVPTTVRPSVTVESLAQAGGGRRLVTTSDGRLLGQATVEAAEDHDHDHDHDHGEEADSDAFDRELADVMEAIEERFGDREPSEAELRSFLRARLVAEGKSAEEADRFLDQLESAEDG